jgi:NADH:ubiquinone oxidoreductase subunit 6 (subunit J)
MNTFPGAEHFAAFIFVVVMATALAGALIAVSTTRIIRSVCGLALCCIGLAGLYYFLNSPFLALMEILVYVGAVCVTIVFAVMLAEPDEPPVGRKSWGARLWGAGALLASLLVFAALTRLGADMPWASAPVERVTDGSVPDLGVALLSTYSLAFEMISLVLLVAILGALVIARPGRSNP